LSAFDRRSYDVAFVDLALPDGNGMALACELKMRQPGLKIVLITGFASTSDDPSMRSESVDLVLPKPWTPAELASALRRIRDNR
jgi:DNA-binding response OmpR family regulator